MADINATLEPGSLRSGVQGEWSDTTRSISPCTQITDYTECQALFPVRIGSPTPSPARECCSSPLWVQGKGETHSLAGEGGDTLACGEGVGGPNSDEGTDTLVWYSMYTIIHLRLKYITEVNFEDVLGTAKRKLSFKGTQD
jgi:hypothetical protein